jgi:hypothetical protein
VTTTSAARQTLISHCNLMSRVVSQGVRFGGGISIGGDGLLDLLTILLSHRGIGQHESKSNGTQNPDHPGSSQSSAEGINRSWGEVKAVAMWTNRNDPRFRLDEAARKRRSGGSTEEAEGTAAV